ncbi:ADP-ribosylglycohydrolase family protein [Fodinicurvata sp. EGI_FJ10296]|uniref:ADP-ribosylglycohydrolase family protein n=1 Tax=Fodinicurvata sp. EGI_FJ10296 TaxID=3231908 RepID=UPI003454004F
MGLANGDAVGATTEVRKRVTYPPLTDMVGSGHFKLEPRQWTDDTSMTLCLLDRTTQWPDSSPSHHTGTGRPINLCQLTTPVINYGWFLLAIDTIKMTGDYIRPILAHDCAMLLRTEWRHYR